MAHIRYSRNRRPATIIYNPNLANKQQPDIDGERPNRNRQSREKQNKTKQNIGNKRYSEDIKVTKKKIVTKNN